MANIKFELFKNRKNFNILNWLKRSKDKSYESFVSFLESKNVISPGEDYFKKALSLLDSMTKRQESFQEEKKPVSEEEQKQTIPINVEVVIPEVVEEVKLEPEISETNNSEVKPKTRRQRRRKKSEDES